MSSVKKYAVKSVREEHFFPRCKSCGKSRNRKKIKRKRVPQYCKIADFQMKVKHDVSKIKVAILKRNERAMVGVAFVWSEVDGKEERIKIIENVSVLVEWMVHRRLCDGVNMCCKERKKTSKKESYLNF